MRHGVALQPSIAEESFNRTILVDSMASVPAAPRGWRNVLMAK
jgi:hypothetical protein